MGLLAIFGITNDGLNLAVNLLLLFLVVFWIALVYWTYADARRRISDPMLVGCAAAAALFPFVGTVVYMIVRPPEYLEDVRERELEIAAAEARLASIDQQVCPYCTYEVEKAFLRCPSCLRRLKEPCTTCGKPLDPRWSICPYCEAEVGQATQPAARRERPRRRERPPPATAPQTAVAPPPPRAAPPVRAARPPGTSGEQRPPAQRQAAQRAPAQRPAAQRPPAQRPPAQQRPVPKRTPGPPDTAPPRTPAGDGDRTERPTPRGARP